MKSNRSARDGLVHARQKFLQRQQNKKMSENFNENESDIKKRLSFLSQLKKDELEQFKQEKMKKESKFKANFNTRRKQRNNTLSFGKAIKSIDITNTKDNEKLTKEHKHSKTESNNNIATPNKINNDDINTSNIMLREDGSIRTTKAYFDSIRLKLENLCGTRDTITIEGNQLFPTVTTNVWTYYYNGAKTMNLINYTPYYAGPYRNVRVETSTDLPYEIESQKNNLVNYSYYNISPYTHFDITTPFSLI